MPIGKIGGSLYKFTGFPEKDDEIGFDVYLRYLNNFATFVAREYKTKTEFINKIWENTSDIVRVSKDIDLKELQRFLFIAWNTEFLLSINDDTKDTEILRVNNQWKPIQTYYSVYSLAEGCIFALDQKIENHTICLKKMSEFFVDRRLEKNLRPWSLAFKGYKGNRINKSTIAPINFPEGLVIPNALRDVGVSPIESIACCLKAEHGHRIETWEKPKRSKELKYKHDPGSTTFFHFLYRLRIRSNYKDAETFMADAPPEKVRAFSDNLTLLTSMTNTLLEVLIIRRIGKVNFINIVETFKIRNKNAPIILRSGRYIKLN